MNAHEISRPAKGMTLLAVLIFGSCLAGCSGQVVVTKEEQARYSDRNPAHIHAPPPGFNGGPPKGATGPPSGATK